MTATNVLLDLLGSPPSSNYYLRLREEIDSVLTSDREWESLASLAKLHRTDSAIRESLRRSPIITRTGMREVLKKDGIQFPNGEVVPQGAWLAIPAVAIHYDERFYPSPETYDPFRFAPATAKNTEMVDPATSMLQAAESDAARLQEPKQGLTTSLSSASPTFLGFGYGRHSWYGPLSSPCTPKNCSELIIVSPGRWFVSLQLKLLIAYIISHYDIEPLATRPLHRIIGSHFVPPSITIKVRRRKVSL